jgi:large subunit ribosomal protein L29
MNAAQIREMTDAELHDELLVVRRRIFDLRSQSVTEKIEDPSLLTKAKRDVARILTILGQRRLEAERTP